MEGYLYKKKKTSFMGNWAKRYYRLMPRSLEYGSNINDNNPKYIDLSCVIKCYCVDENKNSNEFIIRLENRDIELKTETIEELHAWVKLLSIYIQPISQYNICSIYHETINAYLMFLFCNGGEVEDLFLHPVEKKEIIKLNRDCCIKGKSSLSSLTVSVHSCHLVAMSALELFSRLPDSILTEKLIQQFLKIKENEISVLSSLISKLPALNRHILDSLLHVGLELINNEELTHINLQTFVASISLSISPRPSGVLILSDLTPLFSSLFQHHSLLFHRKNSVSTLANLTMISTPSSPRNSSQFSSTSLSINDGNRSPNSPLLSPASPRPINTTNTPLLSPVMAPASPRPFSPSTPKYQTDTSSHNSPSNSPPTNNSNVPRLSVTVTPPSKKTLFKDEIESLDDSSDESLSPKNQSSPLPNNKNQKSTSHLDSKRPPPLSIIKDHHQSSEITSPEPEEVKQPSIDINKDEEKQREKEKDEEKQREKEKEKKDELSMLLGLNDISDNENDTDDIDTDVFEDEDEIEKDQDKEKVQISINNDKSIKKPLNTKTQNISSPTSQTIIPPLPLNENISSPTSQTIIPPLPLNESLPLSSISLRANVVKSLSEDFKKMRQSFLEEASDNDIESDISDDHDSDIEHENQTTNFFHNMNLQSTYDDTEEQVGEQNHTSIGPEHLPTKITDDIFDDIWDDSPNNSPSPNISRSPTKSSHITKPQVTATSPENNGVKPKRKLKDLLHKHLDSILKLSAASRSSSISSISSSLTSNGNANINDNEDDHVSNKQKEQIQNIVNHWQLVTSTGTRKRDNIKPPRSPKYQNDNLNLYDSQDVIALVSSYFKNLSTSLISNKNLAEIKDILNQIKDWVINQMTIELEIKKTKVEELRTLQIDNNEKKKEIDNLKNLKTNYEILEKKYLSQQSIIDQQKNQLEQQEQKIISSIDHQHRLNLLNKEKEMEKILIDNKVISRQLSQLEELNINYKLSNDDLVLKNQQLLQTNEKLSYDYEDINKDNQDLHQKLEQLDQQYHNSSDETQSISTKYQDLLKEHSQLQSQYQQKHNTLQQLSTQHSQQEHSLSSITSSYNKMKEAMNGLTTLNTQLSENLKKTQKEVLELRNERRDNLIELNGSDNVDLLNQISDLENKYQKIQEESISYKKLYQDLLTENSLISTSHPLLSPSLLPSFSIPSSHSLPTESVSTQCLIISEKDIQQSEEMIELQQKNQQLQEKLNQLNQSHQLQLTSSLSHSHSPPSLSTSSQGIQCSLLNSLSNLPPPPIQTISRISEKKINILIKQSQQKNQMINNLQERINGLIDERSSLRQQLHTLSFKMSHPSLPSEQTANSNSSSLLSSQTSEIHQLQQLLSAKNTFIVSLEKRINQLVAIDYLSPQRIPTLQENIVDKIKLPALEPYLSSLSQIKNQLTQLEQNTNFQLNLSRQRLQDINNENQNINL